MFLFGKEAELLSIFCILYFTASLASTCAQAVESLSCVGTGMSGDQSGYMNTPGNNRGIIIVYIVKEYLGMCHLSRSKTCIVYTSYIKCVR